MVAAGQQLGDANDGARRRKQPVDPHPLVVIDLREVIPATIGQEHDDDPAGALARNGQLADDLERGNQCRPA